MFVVAGASGNTGSVVARTLLAQGRKVRVIVRGPAQADRWRAQGADVAQISLEDGAALTEALRGAAGAYLMEPPDPTSADPIGRGQRLAGVLLEAARQSGVGHVVLLSSIGAQHEHGTGIVRTLHDLEQRFRELPAAVTVVRAAYFMENWAGVLPVAQKDGVLPSFLAPAERAIPMVATRDIGETAARALLQGGSGYRVLELSGPRDYSPADVAGAASAVLGKQVHLVLVPQEQMAPALTGFGMSPQSAQQMAELNAALNSGHAAWQGAERVSGTVPLEEVFAGLLGVLR